MTPEMPSEGAAPRDAGAISRRDLLRTAAAGAGVAAVPLLGTTPAFAQAKRHGAGDAGKLVIGAFDDGAITIFKKVLPLFKQQTGISAQLLIAPYDAFDSKAFQDGKSKAGQYDIYIMDDPWVPQFAAAGILEDLGQHGITGDAGFAKPFLELGYWPPRSGPRIKGFESKKPALVALPTIGDLQTMTYRNDIYKTPPKTWHELVTVGEAAVKAGKIENAIVFRGVKTNPIVTSWYPIFLSYGGKFFDNNWKVTFNSPQGKAAADFFVGKLKSLAPKGVAEYDSDQEGAAILGGKAAAIIQYTGNAIKSDDPKQTKLVGKLDFAVVPKQVKALAQIGIFIHGVSASAPNKDNAITFMKWFATDKAQTALGRTGDVPVRIKP
ncbi:MAG: multiple sugar transport system substrate-binding protein, partial [Gaiellales bacterium]|nr:multiple sugar transport system substrate-binding protein [Gaiellales bacterium]